MLTRAASYLPVPDVAQIARYYQDVLGFRVEYQAGDPPEFAIVSRNGLPLMFRRVADPTRIRPNEAQGGAWDVFYWVDDIDALWAELEGKGATMAAPLAVQPYGVKEFAVRDPLGYVLGFGQSV